MSAESTAETSNQSAALPANRADHRRLARPTLSARRHLGRRRRQLLAVLQPTPRKSSCASSTHRPARAAAHRAARAHRRGLALLPARGAARACSTAIASTAPTTRSTATASIPHKLLIEPYAKHIAGPAALERRTLRLPRRPSRRTISPSTSATAPPGMPKCRVIDPAFTWGDDRPPRVPWHDTVIYELHVRGFTMRASRCAARSCAAPTPASRRRR